MLREDDIVADRYRVESLIGEGALARVWRVRHAELGSRHALKLLTVRRDRLAERLILEGRIQAQLRHPDVVAVTDVVRHEGFVGLVMEWVDGVPLDVMIDQSGALDVDRALELMAAVMAGVAAAHAAGVLHRDLKPSNILLARTSRGWVPKVADFGIAKVIEGESDLRATRMGAVMGTPGYLAPEQATDASVVDARADVFALGVILYELLSGRMAFPGGTDGDLFVFDPPPRLDTVAEVDTALADAVHRAMAIDPDDRFETVEALAAAVLVDRPALLERVRGGEGASLALSLPDLPRAPAAATLAPTTGPEETVVREPEPEDAGGRAGLVPWLGAIVLLLGAAGLLLMGGMSEDEPVEATLVEEADPAQVELTPEPATAPVPVEDAVEAEPIEAAEEAEPSSTPEVAEASADAADEEVASPSTAPEPEDDPATAPPVEDEAPPEAAEPEDDAVAVVEPAAEPPPSDDEAAEPAPAEEPPAGAAEPPPPPAPDVPQLLGRFTGTANGLPLRLLVTSQDEEALEATATFVLGPTERRYRLRGTVTPEGAVRLVDDEAGMTMTGAVAGTRMEGAYSLKGGKKALPFEITWEGR